MPEICDEEFIFSPFYYSVRCFRYEMYGVEVYLLVFRGGSRGGGSWGSGPPPPFWGTPKLHKEEKNVARVCAKTPRFST